MQEVVEEMRLVIFDLLDDVAATTNFRRPNRFFAHHVLLSKDVVLLLSKAASMPPFAVRTASS